MAFEERDGEMHTMELGIKLDAPAGLQVPEGHVYSASLAALRASIQPQPSSMAASGGATMKPSDLILPAPINKVKVPHSSLDLGEANPRKRKYDKLDPVDTSTKFPGTTVTPPVNFKSKTAIRTLPPVRIWIKTRS
ncbi:hypothetical protein GUITHDRAFT_136409 [Guillardia theta CCMP2712]|uniref:Uncharacterized protein n=1 Tax=Guillardia theta (strain CCMP2712) TaxID=905079 RepID=L1JKQ8_GUITC|nr:hypothetical protein GUITHDRAFT_136409 [Guillardia theta CCMP2712]EKX48724.1 hypothetical protein GUITHDRAFT_136409 [Guillardia theta CCMP2712]|eukprot:XP_005835704.1 hypothetical protein GUITHDRAFT_136409 [Guillardia theta CCMP2712]